MHAETFHREVLEVSVWMSEVLLLVYLYFHRTDC